MQRPALSAELDLSLRQFRRAWQIMCDPAPGRATAADGGVEYVFSGLPIAFFNIALVTERELTAADLADCGRRACAWAAPHAVAWMFITTHERIRPDVDATAALETSGLAPVMPLTGMITDDVAPPAVVPAGLELSAPIDDAGCAALLDVNGVAYGADLEGGKIIVGKHDFWAGRPVSRLTDVLTIATCAVICGADGWDAIAAYGDTKEAFFRRFLPLPHGIPSADTFARVFAKLAPDAFSQAFGRWMAAACEGTGLVPVAIDGKSARHAKQNTATGCLTVVSAWALILAINGTWGGRR